MHRSGLRLVIPLGLLLLGGLGYWGVSVYRTPRTAELQLSPDYLMADGVSAVRATLRLYNFLHQEVAVPTGRPAFSVAGATPGLRLLPSSAGNVMTLTATPAWHTAETVQLLASFESPSGVWHEVRRSLQVLPSLEDSDQDGFPDAAELTSTEDRQHFLAWFTTIAEAQFFNPSEKWREAARDCAGLVRFAYKEALKRHDARWFATMPYLKEAVIPEVKKFWYPEVPVLSTALFRVAEGSFQVADVAQGRFAPWASSQALQQYNTTFVGREPEVLQQGDLLFFLNIENPRLPYHAMIFLGDEHGDSAGAAGDWVVYHTGPEGARTGVVKKLRLADLQQHPVDHWRPIPSNPAFLGYYRWKIVY
jgi:uncharacterized protein